jgi:hypothetical protein
MRGVLLAAILLVVVVAGSVKQNSIAFLALSVLFWYGAYRYVKQAHLVKRDFPEQLGSTPIWLVRAIGVSFAGCALLLMYMAAAYHPH